MLLIRNDYPARIYVAIMLYNPRKCSGLGDFETLGWWSAAPWNSVFVFVNSLANVNRYWYYYAEADDGAVWAGPYKVMTAEQPFADCLALGTNPGRIVGMRELDIGDNDDYWLTLTP
jgi:uncharacterized membrane protein